MALELREDTNKLALDWDTSTVFVKIGKKHIKIGVLYEDPDERNADVKFEITTENKQEFKKFLIKLLNKVEKL